MMQARAFVIGDRIAVFTRASEEYFSMALAACKRVPGARFHKDARPGGNYWYYPLSVDTCHALRSAFGDALQVGNDLADWYVRAARKAKKQTSLSSAEDATLRRTDKEFAEWLRGYQRAGATWIARGYRGSGLIADVPGLGKTPQMLAGLVEAGISGPVLVVCPKASVRLVWAKELRQHLPDVPVYPCVGTRAKREETLARFAQDTAEEPDRLRVVVVVAEMLRVEMGDPCYTEGGRKVSGMCLQRLKTPDGSCHLHEQKKALRDKDKVPVSFSFPQLFDQWLLGGGWSSIIIDESHKLLGSMNIVKANLMARGLKLLPTKEGHRRYALSGTPFGKGGRAQGMFGTLNWLWPDEYTSFWRWAGEWFDIEEKKINRWNTVKKIVGLKGLSLNASAAEEREAWERFMATLGPRILRRTKAEVLPQLPPKLYVEVPCELVGRQATQHKQLATWAEFSTDAGSVAPNGSLALLTRERQIANGELTKNDAGKVTYTGGDSGKLDQLWERLQTRGIIDGVPGDKLVIASTLNEFLDAIAAMLAAEGVQFLRIDGRVSDKKRDDIVNRWQSECPERVLLVNTRAAGISITLDSAEEMHIMDEDPDPGVNEQLEDRLHRASRVHQVTIYYYRTLGTIEMKRAQDVEFRRRSQHEILDGRRGIAYARQLIQEATQLEPQWRI